MDWLNWLNMAGEVIPKLEQVLEKLKNLERYVKAVDEKVSNLQAKVDCFESFKNEKEKKIKELEDGLDFANTERESFKEKFDKLKCEINQLRDEKLYMEVYQRREKPCSFFSEVKKPIRKRTRERFWLDSLKQSLSWKIQTKSNSKGFIVLESVFPPMVNLDK